MLALNMKIHIQIFMEKSKILKKIHRQQNNFQVPKLSQSVTKIIKASTLKTAKSQKRNQINFTHYKLDSDKFYSTTFIYTSFFLLS